MEFQLSKIFTTSKEDSSTTSPFASLDNSTIQEKETFIQYGKRLCGVSNANVNYLPVYFQRVMESEKRRYILDHNLQEEEKHKIEAKKTEMESQLQIQENNKAKEEQNIESARDAINEKLYEIESLKNSDNEQNREAKIKFYFGLCIISLLTLYLFIFYSSTFYSAFFGSNTVKSLNQAMFNSKAIVNAFYDGFAPLLFVCTAPVIFMGLGYALHYFSFQTSWVKYLKLAGCIIVTFMFDCLLAYQISEKCYVYQSLNSIMDLPPYNMSMAIKDINVWIVIFCGFITYMIWGIVLGMVLTAYGDFRSNASAIAKLKKEISDLNIKIQKSENKLAQIKNNISNINGNIQILINSLQSVHIPITAIKQAVTDFFAGWCSLASVLAPANYNAQLAQQKFDECISSLK